MTNSYEQPLPKERETAAARAHNRRGARMGDPWHVYPEHAAAGPLDQADRSGQICDRGSELRARPIQSRSIANLGA